MRVQVENGLNRVDGNESYKQTRRCLPLRFMSWIAGLGHIELRAEGLV